MEIERVSYTSRKAMVKGVMTMTGEGWQVCGITTLAQNCYRVEFTRQVSSELADDSDLARQRVVHREPVGHPAGRAARPR